MRVFKVCMLIMKRHSKAIFIYIFLFSLMCIVLTTFNSRSSAQGSFTNYKPNISIINRDEDTVLTRGLEKYLEGYAVIVPLEDSDEAIKDANFYRGTDYILIIPEGFSDYILNGGEKVDAENIITPDSARGYLLDEVVNKYFRTVESYASSDIFHDFGEIIDMAITDISKNAEFELIQIENYSAVSGIFTSYLRVFAYFVMIVITLCASTVLMSFEKPEMRMRNYSAPVRPRSIYIQQILYVIVISVIVWIVMILFGLITFYHEYAGISPLVLALLLLNTFIFTIFSIALGMLLSSFITSGNMQSALANIVALVLSFLGGCFVPLELFGDALLNVAQLTPAYWYCSATNSISSLITFDLVALKPILTAFGLQLLFAVAMFMVSMAIRTVGVGSEKSYGNTKTQIAR